MFGARQPVNKCESKMADFCHLLRRDSMSKWSRWRRFRVAAIVILILFAIAAAIVRVFLFSKGILYGESAAKMTSLAVAAIVVTVGAVIMKISKAAQAPAAQASAAKREESSGSVVASISALLGLALVAYSVAELVAPNTPVAAGAPACPVRQCMAPRSWRKRPI
jgi:uncharacterized membrane protein